MSLYISLHITYTYRVKALSIFNLLVNLFCFLPIGIDCDLEKAKIIHSYQKILSVSSAKKCYDYGEHILTKNDSDKVAGGKQNVYRTENR